MTRKAKPFRTPFRILGYLKSGNLLATIWQARGITALSVDGRPTVLVPAHQVEQLVAAIAQGGSAPLETWSHLLKLSDELTPAPQRGTKP